MVWLVRLRAMQASNSSTPPRAHASAVLMVSIKGVIKMTHVLMLWSTVSEGLDAMRLLQWLQL